MKQLNKIISVILSVALVVTNLPADLFVKRPAVASAYALRPLAHRARFGQGVTSPSVHNDPADSQKPITPSKKTKIDFTLEGYKDNPVFWFLVGCVTLLFFTTGFALISTNLGLVISSNPSYPWNIAIPVLLLVISDFIGRWILNSSFLYDTLQRKSGSSNKEPFRMRSPRLDTRLSALNILLLSVFNIVEVVEVGILFHFIRTFFPGDMYGSLRGVIGIVGGSFIYVLHFCLIIPGLINTWSPPGHARGTSQVKFHLT
ncbi:hypothetical protein ACFL0T_06640 [Candidatus Omnitrophota bacterium]